MKEIYKRAGRERTNIDLDITNLYAINEPSRLILESEKFYSDQIKEIVEEITAPESTTKMLLIAGPSSAGKTTTSNLLRLELSMKHVNSLVLSMDNFFINRNVTPKFPDGSYDFENINTLDIPCLNKFIDNLLKKHTAKMPIFNFMTGLREKEYCDVTIDNNTIIIMEGLHALNPKLIKNHESELYRIYLGLNSNYTLGEEFLIAPKNVRLIRRITRDFYTRGYSVLNTLDMLKNVCDGEDLWVKPFRETADYIINTSHKYELLLYAKYTKPLIKEFLLKKNVEKLLESTTEDKKASLMLKINKAKDLYYVLEKAHPLTKDLIPSTSLLWEFVGSAQDMVEPEGEIFNQ